MTWQRIDEGIYIDNTLVTCAEYQLFIDEMRKLGRYYQPDHWRTYQFPFNYGKKPVTGIRIVAAQAFCEWLSRDNHGKFEYRLPTLEEAMKYRIEPDVVHSLGYWTLNLNDTFDFFWVVSSPVAVESVLRRRTFASLTVNRTQGLSELFENAISRAASRPVNLDGAGIGHEIDIARQSNREILHLIRYARSITLSSALTRIEEIQIADEGVEAILDRYIDLITLQERITGRCPAFEGIRLVKERIR